MRLGAHNSRNARKGVRGGLPTRADEAGRSALHRCTRTHGTSVKAVQGAILQILWR